MHEYSSNEVNEDGNAKYCKFREIPVIKPADLMADAREATSKVKAPVTEWSQVITIVKRVNKSNYLRVHIDRRVVIIVKLKITVLVTVKFLLLFVL